MKRLLTITALCVGLPVSAHAEPPDNTLYAGSGGSGTAALGYLNRSNRFLWGVDLAFEGDGDSPYRDSYTQSAQQGLFLRWARDGVNEYTGRSINFLIGSGNSAGEGRIEYAALIGLMDEKSSISGTDYNVASGSTPETSSQIRVARPRAFSISSSSKKLNYGAVLAYTHGKLFTGIRASRESVQILFGINF